MNRRAIAPLIRARQELWKQVDRLAPVPRWRGVADTLSVIETRAIGNPASDDETTALRSIGNVFRARAKARFPVAHLQTRDRATLPNSADVIADAERIARGDWDVLGVATRVVPGDINWLKHPVSGVRAPTHHFSRVSYAADALGGDVKFLWELNRHAQLIRLGQAYWLTRRPEYARSAVALLESWLQQNPPGTGINWISVVDVSFRTIGWCWLWTLTSDSDAWTDERIARLVWAIAHAGRFIARYDSVHHSPNTHLTGEALGLLYIGTVFPELKQSAGWRALGIDILAEEVPNQFLTDGMHYERCTGYHRYNLEFYLHALAIARAEGGVWTNAFLDPVERAAQVSSALRRPDGTWPVLGDEDGGACVRLSTRDVTDQNELLVVAAALLGRDDLRVGLGPDMTCVAWWLLDDAAWQRLFAAPADARPGPSSASLRESGYYVARDDWQSTSWYCAVDAGPHGGDTTGHAHTDVGHVEIAHGAEWISVDPGCSVYTSEPELRNWFRGQRAHASVIVDDVELATPSSPFGWRSVAPTPAAEATDHGTYWYCRLSYDYATPRGTVAHERQVVLIRERGVVVCDFLGGTGSRSLTIRWPLGAKRSDVRIDANDATLRFGSTRVRWLAGGDTVFAASVEPTRRSPKFGIEIDAIALVLSASDAVLPCAIATAFDASSAPSIDIRADDGGMHIAVADDSGPGMALVLRPGVAPHLTPVAPMPNGRPRGPDATAAREHRQHADG